MLISIFLQLFILLPTPIVGKNSLHCCVFLYDHCFRNVLCIVLNKFYIVFSSVDDFNLKFKKQSEKLNYYEGEHCKNWRRNDRTVSECFRAVGRKSISEQLPDIYNHYKFLPDSYNCWKLLPKVMPVSNRFPTGITFKLLPDNMKPSRAVHK